MKKLDIVRGLPIHGVVFIHDVSGKVGDELCRQEIMLSGEMSIVFSLPRPWLTVSLSRSVNTGFSR